MLLQVYTIFDSAAKCYQRPFYCQADGEALRAFVDLAEDKEHPVGKHPEDYSLWRIGSYNDNSGLLIAPEGGMECLARAHELRFNAEGE